MRPLSVGIIGAGTAGSAAALFLSRAGHEVTLYERVPSPGPVGAGITLQPTGMHVLRKLGLYEYVVPRGSQIHSLVCETPARKPIVSLRYETAGPGLFGLGLHRGVLFEALYGAVLADRRIRLRTGVEVVDLARFERGTRRSHWLVDAQRELHGPHELVVVADGARSQLRDDTSTTKTVTPYPWGALWYIGKDPRPADDIGRRRLHQIVAGNQSFLGILPTGIGPSTATGEPLVTLFWSIRGDRVPAWRERGVDGWKKDVLALLPDVAPILDQVRSESDVLFSAYHDVVMSRWSTRNVVYLGDAAHATSPQLGQGCNLALWDAMVLSQTLAAEPNDLAFALDGYSRARRDHLEFYQLATRWLTPFFQGDVAPLGVLRDIAMPIMSKVGVVERAMTLSMLGVVDGFTGKTLTL